MLEYSHTWCSFSLTILYLYLVENTIQIFSLREQDTFLNGWANFLNQNLEPDPLKRNTLEITKKKFEKMYYDYPSWCFIKSIPFDKMDKLIEAVST